MIFVSASGVLAFCPDAFCAMIDGILAETRVTK